MTDNGPDDGDRRTELIERETDAPDRADDGPAEPTSPPGPVQRHDEPPARGGGAVGWGIAFIAAGILWILAVMDVPIAWELVLPAGIILIGVALLAGVRGAARGGLIGLGSVLAVVALIAMAVPSLTFTAGDRQVTVDSIADLDPTYDHGAGALRLDLRELDVPEGSTEVTARVNFGELVVIVPPDATVTGRAGVRIGEVSSFDRTSAGFAPSAQLDEAGSDAGHVLELDLEVGFGRIEVRR